MLGAHLSVICSSWHTAPKSAKKRLSVSTACCSRGLNSVRSRLQYTLQRLRACSESASV